MKAIIKKSILTFACLGMGLSGAFAETGDNPMGLKIIGELDAVYKQQTNYRTPLDSNDPLIEAGYDPGTGKDQRDGANNRASQNVRAKGSLTMVARGQENETAAGKKWNGLIGVIKLNMDAQDPDYRSDEKLDGAYKDKVDLGDVWIRYAPSRAVGIKVGAQSVAATATAGGIGHTFAGDLDEDFIYYTSAALLSKPGVTVDVHLSKDISFGIGQLQGMGDLSALVSMGNSAQANNNVAWFKGGFGLVDLRIGYQSISVGGTEDDSEGVQGIWKHEYSHTLMNWTAKFNLGRFSPFIAQQTISGDKINAAAAFATYDSVMSAMASSGAQRLNYKGGNREVEFSMTTLGLSAGLGEYGKIVVEYTTGATPEWGESTNAAIATEFASTMHVNYVYPLSNKASLTVFYNSMSASEDSKLREDIATATANNSAIDASGLPDSLKTSLKSVSDKLDVYKWSSTSSMGIALKVKFGN